MLITGERNRTRRGWPRWRRSDKNTTGGTMILSPDFRDFFASLNEARVRYLVVGGYAVALHGHPRYTKDIEVWTGLDEENRGLCELRQYNFLTYVPEEPTREGWLWISSITTWVIVDGVRL